MILMKWINNTLLYTNKSLTLKNIEKFSYSFVEYFNRLQNHLD